MDPAMAGRPLVGGPTTLDPTLLSLTSFLFFPVILFDPVQNQLEFLCSFVHYENEIFTIQKPDKGKCLTRRKTKPIFLFEQSEYGL